MEIEIPTFTEIKNEFKKFLESQGHSTEMIWLFREDLIATVNRDFLVKTPISTENERLAEQLYDRGVERGFGVCLSAFAILDRRPCCYVILPEADEDAMYMLMNEYPKLSVSTDMPTARPITSRLRWAWHQMRNGLVKIESRLTNFPSRNLSYWPPAQ